MTIFDRIVDAIRDEMAGDSELRTDVVKGYVRYLKEHETLNYAAWAAYAAISDEEESHDEATERG